MKKLVLTGAAGRLGSYLREPLSKLCDELVSSDLFDDIGTLYPGERYQKADLASLDAVSALMEGADMVIHFGAIGDERPFETLLGPNFVGAYNVWEAAYRHKVRRVVYASSIHAVGMHRKQDFIGTDAPHRPDTFYGLAKCFAEDLASLYWDKRGVESVCMRILSAAQVNNPRALGSWLSYDDLIQLVTRAIEAPTTGFTVVYGVSNNDRVPVDNSNASYLGYRPRDNAEQFAAQVLADAPPADPTDPAQMCHGGPFASVPLGESGVATMNIVNDKKEI
ncbi:MAG: NAD(P)-dependent oxidoreductase [Rhodobacteraceae bacterium]|nr:NAD(P)-dependent oxidoreductase [Paracoccaceae bacterium]